MVLVFRFDKSLPRASLTNDFLLVILMDFTGVMSFSVIGLWPSFLNSFFFHLEKSVNYFLPQGKILIFIHALDDPESTFWEPFFSVGIIEPVVEKPILFNGRMGIANWKD